MVFVLLAVLNPPGALHGLFIIPIMLAARVGVIAGLLAAVGAIGFQAVIQLTSGGAIFMPGTGIYVLSTWGLFAVAGGFSGVLFASLNSLSRRVYEAEHRLAMEHEVLAEMSRIVSSSVDIEEVYERLADKVRTLIPSDRIIVSLADLTAGLVTASYIFDRGASMRREVVLPLTGTITDEVIRSKSGLIFEGRDDELNGWFPTHTPDAYTDFRSYITVPLFLDDEVYGALHLCSATQRAYSERHLVLAERVADQIAGAISQSKLNSELELEVKQRESLAEIARIIGSSLAIEEVYELFADEVRKLVPFDRLVIGIPDIERRFITISYLSGIEVRDRQVGAQVPLEGTPAQKTLTSGSSVVFQGVDRGCLEERLPALLPNYDSGLRSLLAVPLLHHGDTVAVLQIWAKAEGAYDQGHVKLADRIGGQVAGAIANSILYAERANLQDQLLQAQKMEAVGRLAGGIAHDFNNLMTPILSYTQLGADLTSESSQLGRYLQEIHRAGERAAQLTRQLLAFSRHQVVERRIIDLNDLIMNVDNMLRRLIGENVELVYLPGDGPGIINEDPGQIEQVLINMVVNARDAIPGNGRIVVATDDVVLDEAHAHLHVDAQPGDYVMFSVSDDGDGIAKENIEHIFEPFFTTKEVGTGTGLGLSTSYGAVSRNGGFITVESEPGQGATFKVYLPAAKGVAQAKSDRVRIDDLDGCDETILVVEDEPSVLKVACEVLRSQGYTVVEATNGHDALRRVRDRALGNIDLLLTDMVMPLMGGLELAGQMFNIRPETRVLFTSGYSDEQPTDAGERAREVGFLPKPYTPDSLLGKVRQVLDG